mgnify:CR=1 FL=1
MHHESGHPSRRRILRVYFQVVGIFKRTVRATAGHRTHVVMLQYAAGCKEQRIIGAALLDCRHIRQRHQSTAATNESIRMDSRGTGMPGVRAGPLQSVAIQPRVTDTAKQCRCNSRDLVHELANRPGEGVRLLNVPHVAAAGQEDQA